MKTHKKRKKDQPISKPERDEETINPKPKTNLQFYIIVFCVIVVPMTKILDFLISYEVFEPVTFFAFLGFITLAMAKHILNLFIKDKTLTEGCPRECSSIQKTFYGATKFLKNIWNNTNAMILIFLYFCIFCSITVAAGDVGDRLQNAFTAAVLNPDLTREKLAEARLGNEEEAEVPQDRAEPLSSDTVEVTPSPVTEIPQEEESVSDLELLNSAKNIKLDSSSEMWKLTDAERNRLFFKEGAYQIEEDWGQEQALPKVNAYVKSLEEESLINKFDVLAPETLKGQVARASAMEESLSASSEADEIIWIRIDAYTQFGKWKMADLLAENFHFYALIYLYQGGDCEIVVSYYLRSIEWLFECLKYEDIPVESKRRIFKSTQ